MSKHTPDWEKLGPELLEALERAEAALWLVATSGNKDAVEIHAAACAAIAQAKGKTP